MLRGTLRIHSRRISRGFCKLRLEQVLTAGGVDATPEILQNYNDRKEMLKDLKAKFEENQKIKENCRAYYTALYNLGFYDVICKDYRKFGYFYRKFIFPIDIYVKAANRFERLVLPRRYFRRPSILNAFVWGIFLFSFSTAAYNALIQELEKEATGGVVPSGSQNGLPSLRGGGANINTLLQQIMGGQSFKKETKSTTKFSDVIGIEEYKEEVEGLVDFLKRPEVYEEAGAKIPKGILLTGKPGVGKTLLARAIAGEAECSFFYCSGADFSSMFVGMGAIKVKSLFDAAKKEAPSIIFIDEIDSVAGKRLGNANQTTSSNETINQLLTEMDGFDSNEKVIVLAATNLSDALDEAIKRPGRFDKIVDIPLPDKESRRKILNYYISKTKTTWFLDLERIVGRTTGMSGADLKNVVNQAILKAVSEKRRQTTEKDFDHAIDRLIMGVYRKSDFMNDKDKLLTAYHEGGHTLANLLTDSAVDLHKVTILPAGNSLGHTGMLPRHDMYDYTTENLKSMLDVAMGGRVAEELVFGEDNLSTGCSSDLQKATDIATQIVRYMGEYKDKKVHLVEDQDKLSEASNAQIDTEIEIQLRESLQRTRNLLSKNRSLLDKLARKLIEKETLTAKEVRSILGL